MSHYQKVTAIICYEKTMGIRYPLLNEGLSCVYRMHYLAVRRSDCTLDVLIDYRHEKGRPYAHESIENMVKDALTELYIHRYSVRHWVDFGKLYYDIIFVDIDNPLRVEHFAMRGDTDGTH